MRRHMLACLLVVVAVVAGACGPSAGDGDALTIGAIYPVSGRQGPGGVDEERGARLAVELANREGGVKGRKVRLRLVDVDTGAVAPTAMRRLGEEGVRVVIGSYGSTISAPAAVAAREARMLLWETGAVGQLPAEAGPGESFFRMAPQGANLGAAAVAFVRDQLSPLLGGGERLRYAVAYVDDAYGRAVGLGAADEVARSGQELAGTFAYDVYRFDPAELVAQIAATSPDVLFVSAYLDDGVALRKATIDAHLPLRASIGTSSSYCMPSFAAKLGPGAVGLFASDKPDAARIRDDALSEEGRRTLRWARTQFEQRYREPMSPAALAGFANTWALLRHVLPAAAGFAPGQVAAAARAVKLPQGSLANGAGLDLAGPGERDAGENRGAVSVIWQWVDAKTQAVVWPPAFATEALRAVPIQT